MSPVRLRAFSAARTDGLPTFSRVSRWPVPGVSRVPICLESAAGQSSVGEGSTKLPPEALRSRSERRTAIWAPQG